MKTREVVDIGEIVCIRDDVQGKILEVALKEFEEQYRVAWWDGKNRKVEWLESH